MCALACSATLAGVPVVDVGAGVAQARIALAVAGKAAAAPGAATMASATPLYNERGYRGTVAHGHALWYRFREEESGRPLFEVWGRTSSCPVRATLLGARGHVYGELISDASEILPFSIGLPGAGRYYLRIDADPYKTCAGAAFVVRLVEPEQPAPPGAGSEPGSSSAEPTPSETPTTTTPTMTPTTPTTTTPTTPTTTPTTTTPARGTAPSKETAVPPIVTKTCDSSLERLAYLTGAVEREREAVRRHRASVAALRRLEAEKLQVKRRERASCRL
jgi:cell division septation protein DedD